MSLAALRGVLRLVPCLPAGGGSTAGTTGVREPGLRDPPLRPPDVGFTAGDMPPASNVGASPELFPPLGAGADELAGTSTEDAPDRKYCHIASALFVLMVSRKGLWVAYKSSHIVLDLPQA